MFRAGLNVHCCRGGLGVAYDRYLVDGQHVRSSCQPGAIAVTLYDVRHRPAIDLKIEGKIPSEVRHSVHDQLTRRNVTRVEVTTRGTSLGSSADENCAPKTNYEKNVSREAAF